MYHVIFWFPINHVYDVVIKRLRKQRIVPLKRFLLENKSSNYVALPVDSRTAML